MLSRLHSVKVTLLGNKEMATGANGERINTGWLFDSVQHGYGMFIWTIVTNLIFQTLFLSFGLKWLASGTLMSSEYRVILTSSSFTLACSICVQVQAVQLIKLRTVDVKS